MLSFIFKRTLKESFMATSNIHFKVGFLLYKLLLFSFETLKHYNFKIIKGDKLTSRKELVSIIKLFPESKLGNETRVSLRGK